MNGEQKPMQFCNIFCFLIVNLFTAVLSEFVEVPSNDFILEHNSFSSIDMTCRSDYQNRLKWNVRENNDSANEVFYNGYYLREDARSYCTAITDEPRKCYLRLRNAPQVAKTYICVEPGSLREASADLIWISDPVCSDNSVENLINLTCSIEFRGNWAPTMEWRQHQVNADINEGRLVSDVLHVHVDTVVIQNSNITSTLVLRFDSTNYGAFYSCRTFFIWHNGTLKTNITNVPDFNHTWISSRVWSDRPTTTTLTDANGKFTTEFIYLLFGVLSAALLLMMLATAAICCVIVRRKTAEMMAKMVSTYENRERPRSARNSLRFAMDTLRRHTRTMSSDGVERRAREPSEGYTSVDDLAEECNQATGGRPTTSGAPQYGAVLKKRPPGVGAAPAGEQYSLAKEETLYYATLRKNIEPPNWRTNDDDEDSDSESEDLK